MSQDLSGWLAVKYGVLGEHADAAERQATAANTAAAGHANLENVQAGQIPADSASRRALEGAQAGYLGTEGRVLQSNELNGLTPEEAEFHRQQLLYKNYPLGLVPRSAPAASPYSSSFSTTSSVSPPTSPSSTTPSSLDTATAIPQFSHGTPKVPGKGDGTVDKVPAMLAPGEAVLNAGAAEHFGRHNIAALNAVGQAKMQAGKGAPPPAKAAPAKPQHFKGGTHMVGHGKSAQTPKIDPGVIQALMSMGPGGSTPPMGGGAPMMPPAPGMVPPGR